MKLLIAAGGTGGHLFPGIAVARAFQDAPPDGEVLFVGSERGLEREILEREGFRQVVLRVGRIKGEGWYQRLKTYASLPGSFRQSLRILKDFGPDLVLGIGGYTSGPVILAAWWLGIPRAILEPNAVPGFTNRILGRFVDRVFVAFAKAKSFFPAEKVRLTGTPVRSELSAVNRSAGDPNRPFTVLVLGGSQGATAINQAMTAALPKLEASGRPFRFLHQTGANDEVRVREAYARTKFPHEVSAFIADMARVYREADIAVSRAGASTLSELLATGTPSILVPYPYAADDHQRFNAESMTQGGGAVILPNESLSEIADLLIHYEGSRGALDETRKKLSQAQKATATEAVLKECLSLYVSNT